LGKDEIRPLVLWAVLMITCAVLVFITYPGVLDRLFGP